ncbi:MAG: hypothetical protein AAF483_02960 [Planctomycetota bacterium]
MLTTLVSRCLLVGDPSWMEIIEELYKLVDVLTEREIPFAICGGMAVAIHGRPRMTVDIGLVLASEFIDKTAEAVAEIGFDEVTGWIKLPSRGLGIERLFRINKIVGEELLTLSGKNC